MPFCVRGTQTSPPRGYCKFHLEWEFPLNGNWTNVEKKWELWFFSYVVQRAWAFGDEKNLTISKMSDFRSQMGIKSLFPSNGNSHLRWNLQYCKSYAKREFPLNGNSANVEKKRERPNFRYVSQRAWAFGTEKSFRSQEIKDFRSQMGIGRPIPTQLQLPFDMRLTVSQSSRGVEIRSLRKKRCGILRYLGLHGLSTLWR